MSEIWLPVVGARTYGGDVVYEVSNLGQVRSWINRQQNRRAEPRLLRQWPNTSGYMLVDVGRKLQVHQLVLQAFVGPCPTGKESRHLNGVKTDCRLENLVYGTRLEQAADKRRHGTVPSLKGEQNPHSKLTAAQVAEIRSSPKSSRAIAPQFGVLPSSIRGIRTGRTWK